MARQDGFYKVRKGTKEYIMKWTTTNADNTAEMSGGWKGADSYGGHDHDMDFINEKRLTDKDILKLVGN